MSDLSTLIQKLFKFLKQKNITYYLTRNYENYPYEITGDVDIYLDLKILYENVEEYEKNIIDSRWKIFKKIERPWVLVYQLISEDTKINRQVVVLEHFNKFKWLYFDHTNFDTISEYCLDFRGLSVLPEEIGYYLTFTHYFYWAGFVPQKYRTIFLKALGSAITSKLINESFPYCNQLIKKEKEKLCSAKDSDWQDVENIPEKIYCFSKKLVFKCRLFLILRQLKLAPFVTVKNMFSLVCIKIKDYMRLEGQLILLKSESNINPQEILKYLKKYHLYKNRSTKSIYPKENYNPLKSSIYLFQIYSTLAAGGACIVSLNNFDHILIKILKKSFRNKIIVMNHINEKSEIISALKTF